MKTLIGQAIILDKSELKEADIRVLLSTDNFGHIYAIGPNAKKSKIRFVGGLNTFSHIEFSINKKEELFILDESTLIDENGLAFENIHNFITASSLVEVAEKLFTLNNPAETAYYKLKFALAHLDNKKDLKLIFSFLNHSLIDIGEIPELSACTMCQRAITGKKILFNYYRGGIVCNICSKKDNRGENIPQNLYKFLTANASEANNFEERVVRQGIFLYERYIRFKLGISFKSFLFL
ncbi:MAG: DNA repair protein RecO [Deltaproteobacteria bacterium]|nr:DNA repair protein RecO [Deltaproteobacteria bacterium]